MPPKRTRAKKSVKEEVDDLPSLSTFKVRRVDADALFAPILHDAAIEFGDIINQNLQWIFESKEELKKICEDFGGAKTVPKTPKRETAFSKIKDTINMFDNLALTQVPQQPRFPSPLVLDNAVNDDAELPDEVFDDDMQEEAPEREIKTDNSPDARPKTPANEREIKEEMLSEEGVKEEVRPRRGRSRKKTVTPPVVHQSNRSTRIARDVEMREEEDDQFILPQTRIHTPSRIRMGVMSPARSGRSPARVHLLKKNVSQMGRQDSQTSSSSSPSKTFNKNGSKATGDDLVKRAELMRKLQEKGRTAEQNREEQIRERAERAKRDRVEREMKVKAKKDEEEKERMKKTKEHREKEKMVMDIKKRQAQSPMRGGERDRDRDRQGERTPTRLRLGQSPDARLMKRALNTPGTPKVPVKQHKVHSTKKTLSMHRNDSNEDDEMGGEREAKRIELERKRRMNEEAERIKKMKDEEERVARLKEEERRRDEDRRRKEKEEMEKKDREEKEKKEREERMKKLKEEEEKKMKTPVLKNKHLANASMNESQATYEMTPDKIYVAATETNYGVDDLDSGDETDDETNPRKKVPKWASNPQLARTIALIRHSPPFDPDVFFGPIIDPDLNIIFKPSSKYPKRTSSAMWNSPLSNPSKGKSRFLNH